MPKRARSIYRPEIVLDASLSLPLYKQLYERLRGAILAGQLERGARLPSTRALAGELGVSRNTTALAYQLLLLEGYLESRVGQGTVVARQMLAPLMGARAAQSKDASADQRAAHPPRLSARASALETIWSPPHADMVSGGAGFFRGGEPALDLFPYELWARLIARRARQSQREVAYYQPPAGYYLLRKAIATHIGITRGVRCTADQVIVTAGAQGALDLAARTLLNPGDAAWVENPGYFGAQGALLAVGARLVPVAVDAEGLDVAMGRRRCLVARLVSTTPSHQFPTGVTMSLGRRLALLNWAREADAWILEDDYDSEYRFTGRPLEALQGLDQTGRVLYIGTFSKVLFPALRIGYIVAPADLIEPLLRMRRFIDTHIPMLEQMALTDFLTEGHFVRHLHRMFTHYQQRRDLLHHELRTRLGNLLDVYAPDAGMHLVGWLPPGKDDRRAVELAAAAGAEITAISSKSLEPLPRGGLLFGYAGTTEEGIIHGVQALATALRLL